MSRRQGSAPSGPARSGAVSGRFVSGVVIIDAVAMAVVVLAWWKASAAVRVPDELPWVQVSIAALGVAGAGHAALLLQLRLAIGRQRRRLEAGTFAVTAMRAGTEADGGAEMQSDGDTASPILVAAATMRRYHRPGCRLASGKSVRAASAADHETAGRRPCAVCRPPAPPDDRRPAAGRLPMAPPAAGVRAVEERANR